MSFFKFYKSVIYLDMLDLSTLINIQKLYYSFCSNLKLRLSVDPSSNYTNNKHNCIKIIKMSEYSISQFISFDHFQSWNATKQNNFQAKIYVVKSSKRWNNVITITNHSLSSSSISFHDAATINYSLSFVWNVIILVITNVLH